MAQRLVPPRIRGVAVHFIACFTLGALQHKSTHRAQPQENRAACNGQAAEQVA